MLAPNYRIIVSSEQGKHYLLTTLFIMSIKVFCYSYYQFLYVLVRCPGQNKRIAPLSFFHVVKRDKRINNTYT
jgi:hypothetical protein